MRIVTTTEHIRELLKEQREICADHVLKEGQGTLSSRTRSMEIRNLPEPTIKEYEFREFE